MTVPVATTTTTTRLSISSNQQQQVLPPPLSRLVHDHELGRSAESPGVVVPHGGLSRAALGGRTAAAKKSEPGGSAEESFAVDSARRSSF
jgi:hypothetical protein